MSGFLAKWANTPPADPAIAPPRSVLASVAATQADPELDPSELARASAVLNRAGVRLMALEGCATIGVWSDLDGPEVRAALRTYGSDGLPVRYLDGAGVPIRYKLRRVKGEPVPMSVLAEMERQAAEPWNVRARLLKEVRW
jgi:hypothetical protein